jgi:hypothetical protein
MVKNVHITLKFDKNNGFVAGSSVLGSEIQMYETRCVSKQIELQLLMQDNRKCPNIGADWDIK